MLHSHLKGRACRIRREHLFRALVSVAVLRRVVHDSACGMAACSGQKCRRTFVLLNEVTADSTHAGNSKLPKPPSKSLARSALTRRRSHRARIRSRAACGASLLDFTLSEAAAKAKVRKAIPDLRDEEFAAVGCSRLARASDVIDGSTPVLQPRPRRICFASARAALARRKRPPDWEDGPLEKAHPHHREVIAQARATSTTPASRRVAST